MLTAEQIAEALKSEAAKEAIKKAVDEATAGLKDKNNELLGTMKDIKKDLQAAQDEKDEIARKAADKSGDVDQVKAQLEKDFKKREDKLAEENTKLKGQLEKHVIGEGLTQALVKAKVQPALMPAAIALIKSNFKGEVGDNDGSPFAKFDGKAVDEFVTGWAQSDGGKHFVSASNNSGGGSNGATGGGQANPGTNGKKTMTRTEFEGLTPMDKSKVSREGVVLSD